MLQTHKIARVLEWCRIPAGPAKNACRLPNRTAWAMGDRVHFFTPLGPSFVTRCFRTRHLVLHTKGRLPPSPLFRGMKAIPHTSQRALKSVPEPHCGHREISAAPASKACPQKHRRWARVSLLTLHFEKWLLMASTPSLAPVVSRFDWSFHPTPDPSLHRISSRLEFLDTRVAIFNIAQQACNARAAGLLGGPGTAVTIVVFGHSFHLR